MTNYEILELPRGSDIDPNLRLETELGAPVFVRSLLYLNPHHPAWPKTTKEDNTLRNFLSRIRGEETIINWDWDHTISELKPQLTLPDWDEIFPPRPQFEEQEVFLLDPSKHLDKEGKSVELENIDLLLIAALERGIVINIETGKDANAWRWEMYMKDRMPYIQNKLQENGHEFGYYNDGRLKTKTDKSYAPVIITFSVGNGGYTEDLISGEVIVYKPIPLSGWEGLQREGDLLRDSTKQARKDLIKKKLPPRIPYDISKDIYELNQADRFPVPHTQQMHEVDLSPITRRDQLFREVAPQLTDLEQEHRALLINDIQDFAVSVAGIGTKANLVMDLDRIVSDPSLNKRWKEKTGVRITDGRTLFLAFKRLSRDWNINCARAYAQGVTYIDISSGNSDDDADQLWQIHKENGGRWVKNYAQGLKRIYRREELGITDESFVPQIPKMHTCSGGDAPGDEKYESTNDATMLQHAGGFTDDISDGRRPNHNGWPIYLNDYYGLNNEVELINRVLRDFIIGHGHPDKKRRIESRRRRLDNLLNIIALERQLQWTQNPNTQ